MSSKDSGRGGSSGDGGLESDSCTEHNRSIWNAVLKIGAWWKKLPEA